jgi:serine/threonine-protein kinase
VKPSIQRILIHLALAAATIASLGAIGWVALDSWIMPHVAREGWPVVEVPEVSGLSLEDATRKLADLGLEPTVDPERRRADRIGPDLVAVQRPAPGDSVKKGHIVRLWLSAGATTVPVPDVEDQDSSEAVTHMQEAGFQVSSLDYVTSNRVPAGHVLHSDPMAGTLLTRGSSLELVLSSGADPDSIPDTSRAATPKVAPRTF